MAGILLSSSAVADIAVIVHPANTANLSAHTIARIFLGKEKTFDGSVRAIPIDQRISTRIYEDFARVILRRQPQQVKAYWAQKLFTGKGTPPRGDLKPSDVKKLVASNPSFIGYIDSSQLDDSVRTTYRFSPPRAL
jgi:ABC-type phosphate transport system substrate-binding protein